MTSTLIFLHGGPGFNDYLKPYFIELEKKFRCIFYDQMRGPEITMRDLVNELHALVLSCSGKVVLIGHSWGGVLAIEYATTHEEKLAGLILMSTGLNSSQWRDDFRVELKSLGLEEASPEEIFFTFHESEHGKPFLNSMAESFSEETFDNVFSTYLSSYDLTKAFQNLKIPILNIFGEKDVRFPLRVTRAFKTINPEVSELELPDTGHFPFLLSENREKIVDLIEKNFAD